jgi:pimeloyl-ACP methyl ester carboxylesterase
VIERRHLDHDGIRFAYADRGAGPAMVLQHGLGGDAEQPAGLYAFAGRQLVLECRGHGATQPLGPEAALSFGTFAADLRALLARLGIGDLILGGISMGAGVALRFALEEPGRVRALVLVRPAWLDRPHPPNLAIFPEIAALLRTSATTEARERLLRSPRYAAIGAVSATTAASAVAQLDRPFARERAAVLERLPADAPIGADLSPLTMPALVVGNPRDPVHPLELAAELAARVPAARLAVVAPKEDGEERHRREVGAAIDALLGSLDQRAGRA